MSVEFNVVSLKDYAKSKNISYEAVRKQVQKYKDNELKDHIIKKNKTQFLDSYAVMFLDDRRRESPITVVQMEKSEQIEELKTQIERLLIENARLANENSRLANEVLDVQKENTKLALENKDIKLLQESVQNKDKDIAELQATNASQNAKIAEISLESKEKDKSLKESEKRLKTASDEIAELQREVNFYENQKLLDKLLGKKYQKQG